MTLLAPSRLWLLAAAAALVVAYLCLQRRRRLHAVRHPDVALLASVAPRRAGWRRHLTAAGMLLSVVAVVAGLARPAQSEEVARQDAVVVLAIDVSGSMAATDVAPTRMQAAVTAAKRFVEGAPGAYRIGLVVFDTSAHTVVTPTTDRAALSLALGRLRPTVGTAAGEGVATAVDLVRATTAASGVVVTADRPYSAVVLLTDGASTVGRSLDQAARSAADAHVPVFTISYGTGRGSVTLRGRTVAVPSDPAALSAVAGATGGQAYVARTGAELAGVYDRIGTRIGTVVSQHELTVPLAALAAALLGASLLGSMVWSPRLA